eukprot:scaffold304859_cov32-Tisochrysis_lutea.AAC.2
MTFTLSKKSTWSHRYSMTIAPAHAGSMSDEPSRGEPSSRRAQRGAFAGGSLGQNAAAMLCGCSSTTAVDC